MKKICLILGLCLISGGVNAAYVDSGEISVDPAARAWGGVAPQYTGKWYKCTSSVNTMVGGCPVFRMYYTSTISGSGTQTDPYILDGCSTTASGAGCACPSTHYLSGNNCVLCSGGLAASMSGAGYHRNTACTLCAPGYYKAGSKCEQCPEWKPGHPGDSMGGSVPISACYIPKGTTDSDDTGSFEYTQNCNYSAS